MVGAASLLGGLVRFATGSLGRRSCGTCRVTPYGLASMWSAKPAGGYGLWIFHTNPDAILLLLLTGQQPARQWQTGKHAQPHDTLLEKHLL
jgi:hypothetical protein